MFPLAGSASDASGGELIFCFWVVFAPTFIATAVLADVPRLRGAVTRRQHTVLVMATPVVLFMAAVTVWNLAQCGADR